MPHHDPLTPTAGRLDGCVHRLPVRIYYEDTDFSGVVYHANYLRYFERGRSDFLRLAGVSHADLQGGEDPTAFAVTRADVRFHAAARIDDALLVETRFSGLTGPRLRFDQSLHRGESRIAEAAIEACCISLAGRAKRPPPILRARLQGLVEAP